jgi:hypothetical protein
MKLISSVYSIRHSYMLTNVPTISPAATDGTEPVLMYPNVPPLAVRAPIEDLGVSIA